MQCSAIELHCPAKHYLHLNATARCAAGDTPMGTKGKHINNTYAASVSFCCDAEGVHAKAKCLFQKGQVGGYLLVQAGLVQKVDMSKAPGLPGGLVCVEAHFGDIAVWEQLLDLCIISFKC